MEPNGDLVLFYVPLRQDDPYRRRLEKRSITCSAPVCLRNRPQRIWSTGTAGHPGARLVLGRDGSLSVVDKKDPKRALWEATTERRAGASLQLTATGDLQLVAPAAATRSAVVGPGRAVRTGSGSPIPVWVAGTSVPQYVGEQLASGATLEPNQYIQSGSGEFMLYMSPTGILVEVTSENACPLWASPAPFGWFTKGPVATLDWTTNKDEPPGPFPTPGAALTLDTSGVLQLTNSSSGPITIETLGAGSSFGIGGEAEFVSIVGTTAFPIPTPTFPSTTLCPGMTLEPGTRLQANDYENLGYGSTYGQFADKDGGGYEFDVVAENDSSGSGGSVNHVWSDSSADNQVYMTMQSDGNLAIYADDNSSSPLWSTNTSGNPGAFTSLSYNGILGVLTMSWSSGVIGWDVLYTNPASDVGKDIGETAKFSMGVMP